MPALLALIVAMFSLGVPSGAARVRSGAGRVQRRGRPLRHPRVRAAVPGPAGWEPRRRGTCGCRRDALPRARARDLAAAVLRRRGRRGAGAVECHRQAARALRPRGGDHGSPRLRRPARAPPRPRGPPCCSSSPRRSTRSIAPRRSSLVSTDGATADDAGARRFAEHYRGSAKVDVALVLDDIGASAPRRPFVVPWSTDSRRASLVAARTVEAALRRETGSAAGSESWLGQCDAPGVAAHAPGAGTPGALRHRRGDAHRLAASCRGRLAPTR